MINLVSDPISNESICIGERWFNKCDANAPSKTAKTKREPHITDNFSLKYYIT